jgi:hypothetical protein
MAVLVLALGFLLALCASAIAGASGPVAGTSAKRPLLISNCATSGAPVGKAPDSGSVPLGCKLAGL